MQQAPQPPSPTQGLTFGPEDMDALRHGKLTETVQRQLVKCQARLTLTQFILAMPLVFITYGITKLLEDDPQKPDTALLLLRCCGAWIALLPIVYMLFLWVKLIWQLWVVRQDLLAGVGESMTGKTHLYTGPKRWNRKQYVEVGGLRLPVTPWFYELKEPGAAHRVYYLPKSKLLITAERIGDVL
jgi:hypothetical protein